LKAFFNSGLTNYTDLLQILLTLIVNVSEIRGLNHQNLSNIKLFAAMAILLIWIKLLDSLRAFKVPSFYVKLLQETIIDMGVFFMGFFTALITSSVMLFILQEDRVESGILEIEDFFSDRGGQSNSLLNMLFG